MKVATAWLNRADPRLVSQQNNMALRLLAQGHGLVLFEGDRRPLLTDMLLKARELAGEEAFFAWINSDCLPMVDFDIAARPGYVTGFKRIESVDGSVCGGVDAYVIACEVWDRLYKPDLPQMYVGGTHVDWWLTRLAQKHKVYQEQVGLWHESHEKSATSWGRDQWGEHNLKEYGAWAERNGVSLT